MVLQLVVLQYIMYCTLCYTMLRSLLQLCVQVKMKEDHEIELQTLEVSNIIQSFVVLFFY